MTTRAFTIGFQDDAQGGWIKLYTLLDSIPGHPAGSTITRETAERVGYQVQAVPAPKRGTP